MQLSADSTAQEQLSYNRQKEQPKKNKTEHETRFGEVHSQKQGDRHKQRRECTGMRMNSQLSTSVNITQEKQANQQKMGRREHVDSITNKKED